MPGFAAGCASWGRVLICKTAPIPTKSAKLLLQAVLVRESYEDKQPGEDMVMIGGEEASQPSFSHRDSQPPPQQEQPQPSRPSEPPHAQERQGSGEASGQEGGSTGSEAVGRTGQQHVAPEAQADGSEVGEKGGTNTESSSQEGQANPAQAESHEGTG
eukprot:1154773-Pelagomonas_calceolata.AAC.8